MPPAPVLPTPAPNSGVTSSNNGVASVAARSDERNPLSLRFLRGGDVYEFFLQSPGNRGGVGKLPKSESDALSMINAVAPRAQAGGEAYTAADLHIHYLEAANSSFIPDRFMFLSDSTLRNIAADAADGFAFMNCHRTGGWHSSSELPMGRTFCGRYETITEEDGETRQRAVVGIYMLAGEMPNGNSGPSTDTLHKAIDAGTLFDASVGLYGGSILCDVCGHGLFEYDEDYNFLCAHYPGSTYRMTDAEIAAQEARGVTGGACSVSLHDAHCGEVSGVYDGAVPGAGFRKALTAFQSGNVPEPFLAQLRAAYGPTFAHFAQSEAGNAYTVGDGTPEIFYPAQPGQVIPIVNDHQSQTGGTTAAARGKGANSMPPTANRPQRAGIVAALSAAIAGVFNQFNIGDQNADPATPAEQPEANPALFATVPPVTVELSPETKQRIDALETSLATERTARAAAEAAQAETAKAAQLAANIARVDGLVKDFRVTPAAGDQLKALATSNPDAFAAAIPAFEANGKVVALAGLTDGQANPDATGSVPAEQLAGSQAGGDGSAEFNALDAAVKQFSKANPGLTYGECLAAVCREKPELANAYRAATG